VGEPKEIGRVLASGTLRDRGELGVAMGTSSAPSADKGEIHPGNVTSLGKAGNYTTLKASAGSITCKLGVNRVNTSIIKKRKEKLVVANSKNLE